MDITLLEEQEKPLLKRKEFSCKIAYEGSTPSRPELADAIASKVSCPRNMLVIKKIDNNYGETNAEVLCHCYSDEKVMKTLERDNLLNKHTKKQEKKEAAAEAVEAPTKAPVEDTPVEAPKEAPAEAPVEEAPKEVKE